MQYSKDNLEISANNCTIPKNTILNWLYATDRHVSLSKLGFWLEEQTGGKYTITNNNPSAKE